MANENKLRIIIEPRSKCICGLDNLEQGCSLVIMAARFPPRAVPTGRLTPSNLNPTAPSHSAPMSPVMTSESDQAYLDRLKVREVISEAYLHVVRMKPNDPIDFLYNYFDSQCQIKPFERALTRLHLINPQHASFDSVLVELYSDFNRLNEDTLLLKGDVYNKLLDNLCDTQTWIGSKEHRTSLLALVSLRPNDAVSFGVFKYGIQAILLAKEFENAVRSMYNSLANSAGANTDIDRSLCESLVHILAESLAMIHRSKNDAFSLHQSVVQLSLHQVKQSLEQRWSPPRSSTPKHHITFEDFLTLARPVYLKTIQKIP